jgi:alkanesulfonate monooxygenase SsuD/methylene tetrahydromethanopterin reductase-like flavin-dependent oxidoreductase (luciferase family)
VDLVVPSPPRPEDDEHLPVVARNVEAAGLDGLWIEDHLATRGQPARSATVLAGAALAATEHLTVGLAILAPALRPLAWAACDVATLRQLGGDRFQLGVGAGAGPPEEWAAAGAPRQERWRRRDGFLELIRPLLAGEEVTLPDTGVSMRIAPQAGCLALWVGGPAAKAAAQGGGWLPGLITPTELAEGASLLPAGTSITLVVHAAVGGTRSTCASILSARYGLDPTRADELAVGGTVEEVAAQLAPFLAAGAHRIAVSLDGGINPLGIEQLRAVRDILQA